MNRRKYLATAAGTGLAALAGCSTAVGEVAPPSVPEDQLEEEGWEQTDENQRTVFEKEYGPVTVTAKSHSLTYSDTALRGDVREKTLGEVDTQMAVFSATHIDFGPDLNNLPANVGRKEILDQTEQSAREQFVGRMNDAGIEDVSQTETGTIEVKNGDASHTVYEGRKPIPEMTASVPGDETVTVDLDDVAIAGELAVWNDGDYVLVGGGAYPAENVADNVDRELSDAISVSMDIDLGLTPDGYQEEVRNLIGGVK